MTFPDTLTLMARAWVPVENYEDRYLIGDLGDVISLLPWGKPGWRQLKPGLDEAGRPHVSLHSGSHVYKTARVCVLVARAFIGKPPPGEEVCHEDGNPQHNWTGNVRYDTHLANGQDMIRHGRTRRKCTGSCGHPLDGRKKGRNGRVVRYCLRCNRKRAAAWRKSRR